MPIPLPPGCEPLCRGCSHKTYSANDSESQKLSWVKSKLSPWSDRVEAVKSMSGDRLNYRNKVCLHAEWKEDHWAFGMLVLAEQEARNQGARWSKDYEVLDISSCPVHSHFIYNILNHLKHSLPHSESFPLVYLSISGSLVVFVFKSKNLPAIPALDWKILGVRGVFANLNPSAGRRVYSNRGWKLIWGNRFGNTEGLLYGPDTFQQLIPALHGQALEEMRKFISPTSNDGVLDLCSGIGHSLKLWKNSGASYLGVELSGEAVECCEQNIGPGSCLRGRVSERLPQLQDWVTRGKFSRLLVYANPSRLGLEPEVLTWLAEKARPEKIAYLSCSAGTLSRDLHILTKAGYVVERVIPYDFFPRTHHIEVLVLLSLTPSSTETPSHGP